MTEHRQSPETTGEAVRLIERVRRRARATLITAVWVRSVALVLVVVLVLGLADYVFRLPRVVRVVHLAALAYGAWELARRVIVPAMRFRPGLAEVALRVERATGKVGQQGRLASGVDLGRTIPPTGVNDDLTAALARRTSAEADAAVMALRARRFVRRTGLARAAGLLAIVTFLACGSAAVRPDLARIGIARTLWPFAPTEWPKRTALADATLGDVHPLGEALPLRALLTRTSQPLGATDVAALYRVVTDGRPGRTERVMLTSQDRFARSDGSTGELYERLIEPVVDTTDDREREIEYWFETDDNRTEPSRIRLAARPRVDRITATVTPPAYARTLTGTFLQADDLDVTPDGASVAAVQAILAGSTVRLSLDLSKPARRVGPGGVGWSQPDPRTLRFEAVAGERTRLEISLADDAGLTSADPLAIVLDVVRDAQAAVTVIEPAYDESVLATAVIGLEAEGRDDFGMRWLALERQTARPPADSEGAPPEPTAEPVRLGISRAELDDTPAELTLTTSLDLSTSGARAGDEVWISATGRDVFAAPQAGHDDDRLVRSAMRRLRIIDEATFADQVRGELAGVRRAAIEIDSEQTTLQDPAANALDPAAAADRQDALTERLDAQRGAIDRLTRRIDRNALNDETLSGTLDDATGLLRDATGASARAAADMEAAAAEGRDPESSPDAREAQARVRDSLETLIAMLDQGQDNWVARRTIEGLLADQRALAAETEALGDRTMGQSPEQLSSEDLTELERIAARQRDAADRARQALDSLTERAESLKRVDSAQAQAMSQAARRGRQEQLDEQMRQAAAQISENQTRAAAQGQQAATEALEEMLEDIDSAEASRDQALRRVLATVLESLAALIAEQESQIDALTRARLEEQLVALAGPMVALAGNTLGLLDEIGPQRDLAAITSLVGLAAEAQERAVGSLRSASVDSAAEAEDESLARLREARDEAERMEEAASSRESARKRAELRTAYRTLLEQQVAITDDTLPWVGVELDRRTRAQVRALGQRQEGVSESLAEIRRTTAELADAAVFSLAHRRLDAASHGAAEALLAGQATGETARHQATVVRLLRSLIEAMAEQNQDRRFGDQQSSGGGGGGGGSGDTPIIPDLAELKLLRAMQAEAMEWTRNIDEAPARPSDTELADLAGLQQELAERAEELVNKLTQQQGGPQPGEDRP